MDIEAIIERVTEQVYKKLAGGDYAGGYPSTRVPTAAADPAKVIYTFMDVSGSLAQVKSVCEKARAGKFGMVLLPQWFVPFASEALGDAACVATIVGLPGGLTSTFAKYAEVKQAVINGARAIMIPMNMKLIKAGDYDAARGDLAEAMAPCKGKAKVYAMVEAGELNEDALRKAAAVCSACGVDCLLLSGVCGGRITGEQMRNAASQGVCVGAYGSNLDQAANEARKAGDMACYTIAVSA